jgi:hypothetical protein
LYCESTRSDQFCNIQVKVNYHGTVDGKIFDSSVDKDWLKTQKRKAEPIVFKVRQSTSLPLLGNVEDFGTDGLSLIIWALLAGWSGSRD